MFPTKSMLDCLNSRGAYREHFGDFSLRENALLSKKFNFLGILFCQFHLRILFSDRRSSLRSHILPIILLCSQEKMFRVHARRIVALMEHLKPLWNRAFEQSPGSTMGSDALANRMIIYPAVAKFVSGTSPNPAARCFKGNLFQESSSKIGPWFATFIMTLPRAVVMLVVRLAISFKFFAAIFAIESIHGLHLTQQGRYVNICLC